MFLKINLTPLWLPHVHRLGEMNQTKDTTMESWRTRSWKQSKTFQLVAAVAGKSYDIDDNDDDLNHDDDLGINN